MRLGRLSRRPTAEWVHRGNQNIEGCRGISAPFCYTLCGSASSRQIEAVFNDLTFTLQRRRSCRQAPINRFCLDDTLDKAETRSDEV